MKPLTAIALVTSVLTLPLVACSESSDSAETITSAETVTSASLPVTEQPIEETATSPQPLGQGGLEEQPVEQTTTSVRQSRDLSTGDGVTSTTVTSTTVTSTTVTRTTVAGDASDNKPQDTEIHASQSTDATTAQIPPKPECLGHRKPLWNNYSKEWECVQQTWLEAGISCSAIQQPRWVSASDKWECGENLAMRRNCLSSLEWFASDSESNGNQEIAQEMIDRNELRVATVSGRQSSETLCIAKGDGSESFAVCFNAEWFQILSVSGGDTVDAAKRCLNSLRGETDTPQCQSGWEARLVDGEWWCFKPCEEGYAETIDAQGTRWCLPLAECGAGLVSVYVEAAEGYVCSETEETSEQFWEYAFYAMGIRGDAQKARWIGGLGMAYNKNLWREYMADPNFDYSEIGGVEVWEYFNLNSAEEQMRHIAAGVSHVHICYEHDCEKLGNLVGSTDSSASSCRAFVWHSKEGLWFLMRIDESALVCVRAFAKVASGEINGASAAHSSYGKDTGRTAPKDGIERPVFYSHDVVYYEVTLTESSKNLGPVDNHTWVSAIDLR